MAEISNGAYVGEAIRQLRTGLRPFVESHMSRSHWGRHWVKPFAGSARLKEKEVSLHDARFLLRVIDDCWTDIFCQQFPVPSQASVRNLVKSLRSDGNAWAHTQPIEDFAAQHVISGVVRLLTAVDAVEAEDADSLLHDFNRSLHERARAKDKGPATDAHRHGRSPVRPRNAGAAIHAWFIVSSPLGTVFVAHHGGEVSGLRIANDSYLARDPALSLSESNWGILDTDGFAQFMLDEVGAEIEAEPEPDRYSELVARVEAALEDGRTDVPVDLSSRPPFHREALRATSRIPRGESRTYKEVAEMAGSRDAQQSVGNAMKNNPVPLLIPCHRVLPSAGGIGGWGYGTILKDRLLRREGVLL